MLMKAQPNTPWMTAVIALVVGLVSPHSAGAQEIAAKLLQEDFQIMRRALEEAHGGIYRYTSRRDLDRAFERAYRKIDHPMTSLEFWRLAAPVVSQIRCGHTCLLFPKGVQEQLSYRDRNGKHQSLTLDGMIGPDWDRISKARYATPPVPAAELKFMDDGKIAVLTLRGWFAFADEKRKVTFTDFLKSSFAQIQEEGTRDLIIDVRDNGGGLDMPVIELFSYIGKQPFRVYRRVLHGTPIRLLQIRS